MDALANLAHGFEIALTPWNLLYAFIGAMIGTAIGVLPGLGPPATIALLLPTTYKMDATSAVIMLAGIFYGAMYGGSTTSILMNIPGEAASVVTCLDGYKMATAGAGRRRPRHIGHRVLHRGDPRHHRAARSSPRPWRPLPSSSDPPSISP